MKLDIEKIAHNSIRLLLDNIEETNIEVLPMVSNVMSICKLGEGEDSVNLYPRTRYKLPCGSTTILEFKDHIHCSFVISDKELEDMTGIKLVQRFIGPCMREIAEMLDIQDPNCVVFATLPSEPRWKMEEVFVVSMCNLCVRITTIYSDVYNGMQVTIDALSTTFD